MCVCRFVSYSCFSHFYFSHLFNLFSLIKSYQQCDIFILPNRTIENDIEGFGMVLVEAQACGKPVIAGDSGGTAETMIVGKTGEIIDCSSPQSIVKGMLPVPGINKLT